MKLAQLRRSAQPRNAVEIAMQRLCIGCGACAAACPDTKLNMVDFIQDGLRPVMTRDSDCAGCPTCEAVCPGVGIDHTTQPPAALQSLYKSWGPVIEVWEGFASDLAIRHQGSSGGLASALALYGLERGGMHGLLHIRQDETLAFRNKTAVSHTREELLDATGSRYSPASPCEGLRHIESADGPSVFIGKPCDIEATRKTALERPQLAAQLGITIGIFCAGTPSTQGTIELLQRHGVNPAQVEALRYRGNGWPGSFAVRMKGSNEWCHLATYQEAWGFIQKYRPYRCHLCPDGTSEFADISCGDPWYREIPDDEPGMSLALVRTERGRRYLADAIAAGYVRLERVDPSLLERSQKELQLKRGAIWGRVLTMRAMGVPAPAFKGFALFRNWLALPLTHKLRSLVGTARRIVTRGYRKALSYPWLRTETSQANTPS
jgi:coenzyme F420 hydrogenase subunit beta